MVYGFAPSQSYSAVIITASLLLLCLLSPVTSEAQTQSQCGSGEVRYTFGAEISIDEREAIRNRVTTSVTFICSKTNVNTSDASVFAYANFDKLIEAYAQWFHISTSEAKGHWGDNGATAISGSKVLFIYTASQGWQQSTPYLRLKIITHEFFHIMQYKLGGTDWLNTLPTWFIEGSAEYVGFKGVYSAGLYSFSSARTDYVNLAKSISSPLNQAAGFDKYVLGFLAVDFLLGDFDIATLAAVWDITNGKTPAENFQQIFGRSLSDFTSQFEVYRSNSFPLPSQLSPSAPLLVTEGVTMRAAALDSVTSVRDPFSVTNVVNFSLDQRTRIIFFARNVELMPGESLSSVLVQAEDSHGRNYVLPVEYVGKVPNFDWLTQVNVRLPDEFSGAGNIWIQLMVRGSAGNRTFIHIK